MPTFKMTVAYDGTAYCGWQVQVNGDTIQQQLEIALAKILCQRVRVTGGADVPTRASTHSDRSPALRPIRSCRPPG